MDLKDNMKYRTGDDCHFKVLVNVPVINNGHSDKLLFVFFKTLRARNPVGLLASLSCCFYVFNVFIFGLSPREIVNVKDEPLYSRTCRVPPGPNLAL